MISLLLTLFISLFSICPSYNKVEEQYENNVVILNESMPTKALYNYSGDIGFYTGDFSQYVYSWANQIESYKYVVSNYEITSVVDSLAMISDLPVVSVPSNGFNASYFNNNTNFLVLHRRVKISTMDSIFTTNTSVDDITDFNLISGLSSMGTTYNFFMLAFNLGYLTSPSVKDSYGYNRVMPSGDYYCICYATNTFSGGTYSINCIHMNLYCHSYNSFGTYSNFDSPLVFSSYNNGPSYIYCFDNSNTNDISNSSHLFDSSISDLYRIGYYYGDEDGYEHGYENGLLTTQAEAYQEGKNDGLVIGRQEGYNTGFDDGKVEGRQEGYADGLEDGYEANSTALTIFSGILEVGLLPVNVFLSILNFEVFDINIGGFVSSILTISIVIIIVRFLFGGKNDK